MGAKSGSHSDDLGVESDFHARREQVLRHIIMQAHVVAQMDEESTARRYAGYCGKRLRQRHVRNVFLDAKSVDNQCVYAANLVDCLVGDILGVGDICHISYFVAKDGQLLVHDPKRLDEHITDGERLESDGVEVELRHTRIGMLLETIWDAISQVVENIFLGIDVKAGGLAIGTQVVNTAHMVVVAVGNEQRIEFLRRCPQNLLTEIGTTVDEQAQSPGAHHRRTAQALVAGII